MPIALLEKFDRVPDLARIYDNGNIQIHERRVPVTLAGGQSLPSSGGAEQARANGVIGALDWFARRNTHAALPAGRGAPNATGRAYATTTAGGTA